MKGYFARSPISIISQVYISRRYEYNKWLIWKMNYRWSIKYFLLENKRIDCIILNYKDIRYIFHFNLSILIILRHYDSASRLIFQSRHLSQKWRADWTANVEFPKFVITVWRGNAWICRGCNSIMYKPRAIHVRRRRWRKSPSAFCELIFVSVVIIRRWVCTWSRLAGSLI